MDPYKGEAPEELKTWLDRLIKELPKTGTFTLDANDTSTVVTDSRVNSGSIINITPTTSTAASEMGTIYITAGSGQFTLTHSNTADDDKTFNYRF